ncbi:hypothetical protein [uncultured Roseibium sp.]|uniref:hypothetical protein n=1 Tax=uncultured Roseibium sp. TaxID=1936171 RepID=UPI00262BB0E9|nr:hypothetical protein [uncultured Roseibium sp.]
MDRTFEAARLDISDLAGRMPGGSSLAIETIRKADMKRLTGLDVLPLATLSLRWLSAPNLEAVPLPATLTELRIWHSSKLKGLKGIEAAPDLETLELRETGLLEDAADLKSLPKLRSLSIVGGPPSLQKIASLDFLNGLPLTELTLTAIDGAKLDLTPITQLPNLEQLYLHGPNFQPSELAKVAAAYPWFFDQLMDLPDYPIDGMPCKKCRKRQKELFLKGKKGLWCPECDSKGLTKILDDFSELVASFR